MESDSSSLLSLISLFIVFLIVYTFFVIASVAVSRSGSARLRTMEGEGVFFARAARLILVKVESLLLMCHLGELVAILVFGWGSMYLVLKKGVPVIDSLSSFAGDEFSVFIVVGALVLFFVVATFLFMQLAKSLVSPDPEKALCLLSWPLSTIYRVYAPIGTVLGWVSEISFSIFQLRRPIERELAITAEEINEIVEHSEEAGEIEEDEMEMIRGVFSLSDTEVHEVMTPRKDIIFVSDSQSILEIVNVFCSSGFSRILVCGEELDDIKGLLYAKDLIAYVGKDVTGIDLIDLMRDPYFIPEGKMIDDLLEELKGRAIHLAVVLDEHGGIDGLVTVEDLLEEIVGEISDEFDSCNGGEPQVEQVSDDDYIVDGNYTIYDLNNEFNLALPEGEYNTIAGFIFSVLGRIPDMGEEVVHNGMIIRVEALERNRIKTLRIFKSDSTGVTANS